MKNLAIPVLILLLACLTNDITAQEIWFDIISKKGKSINSENLQAAQNLRDLNAGYPSSWIKKEDYVSTSISLNDNIAKSMHGEAGEILSTKQKNLLSQAQLFSNIGVEVIFYIDNVVSTDKYLDTMNFTVTVTPENEAIYTDGYDELKSYLKQNIIQKISALDKKDSLRANIQFTIDMEGHPKDVRINTSSSDSKIDQILIDAIHKMPRWKPAETKDGIKLDQQFEFVIGNVGC